jgi:hypothetical protein
MPTARRAACCPIGASTSPGAIRLSTFSLLSTSPTSMWTSASRSSCRFFRLLEVCFLSGKTQLSRCASGTSSGSGRRIPFRRGAGGADILRNGAIIPAWSCIGRVESRISASELCQRCHHFVAGEGEHRATGAFITAIDSCECLAKSQRGQEQRLLQRVEDCSALGAETVDQAGTAPVAGTGAISKPRCFECRKLAPMSTPAHAQAFLGKGFHDDPRTLGFA